MHTLGVGKRHRRGEEGTGTEGATEKGTGDRQIEIGGEVVFHFQKENKEIQKDGGEEAEEENRRRDCKGKWFRRVVRQTGGGESGTGRKRKKKEQEEEEEEVEQEGGGTGGKKRCSRKKSSPGSVTPSPRLAQGSFDGRSVHTLTFQNVTYKVAVKNTRSDGGKTQKELLKNVSGEARSGEILAIVGPSGAGKSALLDALAGRIAASASSLEGLILVNGRPMDSKQLRKLSAYVAQDDALFAYLTVKETLLFSARLRLPADMPIDDKVARVDMLIATLGLSPRANTRIGNEQLRGLSEGERRLVSIAVELLHDPAVLFLDQPTSGLDSTSALNLVQNLYQMATQPHRPRTILMTCHHRPSHFPMILDLIHKIMILSRGSLVYSGTYPDLSIFLDHYGRRVPPHVNAMEFALDIIDELQESAQAVAALADFNSARSKLQPSLSCLSNIGQMSEDLDAGFATGPVIETLTLCHRNVITISRTPELFASALGLMIVTAVVLGSLFYGDLDKDESGKFRRSTFFAFICALLSFTAIHSLPMFLLKRNVFVRETSRGAYRTSSYVLATGLVFLPFFFIQCLLLSLVAYLVVGLVRDPCTFFLLGTTMFLTITVGNAFVRIITSLGSLIPNFVACNTIITAITGFMFLFSGFLVPKDDFPNYWIWFRYVFRAFRMEYTFTGFKYLVKLLLKKEYTRVDNFWQDGTSGSHVARQRFRFWGDVSVRIDLALIAGMVLVYRILFYVGLCVRSSSMRK
ncbi:hypothetical protein CBR_g38412 [Chara braunii]|uniref:ABC transporter domain-containing protein n=1 Tax=Chara braunii TaxID=69332 RepID=A0A388JNJ1_CHABU|nr:hypothetical protein CBR_g38412 [Chara braunii]|eukprot:GBG59386.1 hypothetical protein CBR_g38412 [Chara braunii]